MTTNTTITPELLDQLLASVTGPRSQPPFYALPIRRALASVRGRRTAAT
jgi:hypothetical protein